MDRADLDRAMGDASRPSKPGARSSPISSAEVERRTAIFSRLFTLYPLAQTQDAEGTILAYIEETLDVPLRWLEAGIRSCARELDRRFAPSVGEIRGAAQRARSWAERMAAPGPTAQELAEREHRLRLIEAHRQELLKLPPGHGAVVLRGRRLSTKPPEDAA